LIDQEINGLIGGFDITLEDFFFLRRLGTPKQPTAA